MLFFSSEILNTISTDRGNEAFSIYHSVSIYRINVLRNATEKWEIHRRVINCDEAPEKT